ncbi:MAG: RdgB/HAM1 family non-canonical purine NTP pyrophosphatase [Erysipelotrichaceae bacterium]|nr:RdgB/HAM1 family non-canonical purine NTP pyrophosphatase [Erysipelotrichaceae bacterium]
MDIIIASNNLHKVSEYKEILCPLGFNVFSLKDENIECEIAETGSTFKENSLIKALEIAKYTNKIILADDSGLILEAFPNILGVYSHRFMPTLSYKGKCEEVLKLLKNKNRGAYFTCVITLINFKDKPLFFEGICKGHIGYDYVGDNGFGYDPIFIPNGYDKTMAMLTSIEKNKISHRGIACEKLIEYLKDNMEK